MARATMPIFSPSCGSTSTTTGPPVIISSSLLVPDILCLHMTFGTPLHNFQRHESLSTRSARRLIEPVRLAFGDVGHQHLGRIFLAVCLVGCDIVDHITAALADDIDVDARPLLRIAAIETAEAGERDLIFAHAT